jgi:hypothetical protein
MQEGDKQVTRGTAIRKGSAITAGLLCAAAFAAACAQATTVPGKITKVPVTIRSASIQIKADRYTHGKTSEYPRGAVITFVLHNLSQKTVRIQLATTSNVKFYGSSQVSKITRAPKALIAGGRATFQIFFFFRAKFALQALVDGKVRASAPIVIF